MLCLAGLLLLSGCWREVPEQPEPTSVPPPTAAPESDAQGLPAEIELEELRLVVRTLAAENRRLKQRIQELLQHTPPDEQSSPVAVTPVPESPEPTEPVIQPASEPAEVLYVNPNWHYLVISQGAEEGFTASKEVEIIREGVSIATATITESKPGQAVAEIDLSSLGRSGLYPRENDGVQLQ